MNNNTQSFKEACSNSKSARALALLSIEPSEATIYQFFIKRCGSSRVPKSVSLSYVARYAGLSYKATRLRVDKLLNKGLIEKWTNSFKIGNVWKKECYYRLKL